MKLTYKDAGVDIEAGNELVNRIKPLAAKTNRAGLLGGIGGFGGLFEIPLDRYKNPVLVSATDGVGTKLKLAIDLDYHETIGIDLVAMCVNDIIVSGAEPLYFLDYFATGKLEVNKAERIIAGIAAGCKQANIALLGGETAEMPGLYLENDYDLAGFSVGVVEKTRIITGDSVTPGDVLIALPSSGVHSNGFSLVRKILSHHNLSLAAHFHGKSLGEELLTPTKIYVKSILELLNAVPVKALAHITGGGLLENLPRVLPRNVKACIHRKSWQLPEIFCFLKEKGSLTDEEMFRTFNCGVGMVIIISPEHATTAMDLLTQLGEQPWNIGEISAANHKTVEIIIE